MAEWRLYEEGTTPDCTTVEWYAQRDRAPHLEQEGHRERLLATAEMVAETAAAGARHLCDLGAGDGGLLQAVRDIGVTVPAWGYDLQPSNVTAAAERGVSVELADILAEPVRYADALVAAEVLEHLLEPHQFLAQLAATDARWLIASSPYTESPESHYEHHLWAWDLPGYRILLENAGWVVRRQRTAWISQIVLAERAG